MVQGTTPTFVMTFPQGTDFSEISEMVFTLTQGRYIINKKDCEVEGRTVSVFLRQLETLRLDVGKAKIQLNWTYANGERACSVIKEIDVDENLLREVIT